jgi:chromate transporter
MTTLLRIAGLFGLLSLLSVGGGNGVIPDMQRAAVDQYHWMTAREFLDSFAISRAAPGPGSLIVLLVGLKAAGVIGAVLAVLAMYVPSGLIVFLGARAWGSAARAAWRAHAERALAPVAVGLTYASGIALARSTEHDWQALLVTAAATLALALTELHPLLVLVAGAGALLLLGG